MIKFIIGLFVTIALAVFGLGVFLPVIQSSLT